MSRTIGTTVMYIGSKEADFGFTTTVDVSDGKCKPSGFNGRVSAAR